MSNDSRYELDMALGQLEDELIRVKSARDQVESVLLANEKLVGIAQQSSSKSEEAAAVLAKEASRLTSCTETIEKASSDALETLRQQVADAKISLQAETESLARSASSDIKDATNEAVARLEDSADEAIANINTTAAVLTNEVTRLTSCAETIEKASGEDLETLRQQVADAKISLQAETESLIRNASSEIGDAADEAVAEIGKSTDEAITSINTAAAALSKTAAGLDERSGSLLEAHEAAMTENQRVANETKLLIEAAQEQLAGIDARVAQIENIKIESLSEEVKSLKEAEQAASAGLQKQVRTLTILVGVCIAACLVALAKLLVG